MAREADFQKNIIKWLRSKGCIVIKYQQNATTRASVPDIIFLHEGFWGAIEVKKTKTSPFRPGQKEMIKKMDEWSWAKIVWGGEKTNWPETQKELDLLLR